MTKDLKYIIKRIVIGVGIILAMSLIRGIFILDVQALEVENGHTTPIYYVPNKEDLHFCDNLITNFNMSNQGLGYCSEQYITSLQLHYYSNMLPSLNEEYPYYIEDTDNPTYSNTGSTKWYNAINYHTLYNLVGYNIGLYRNGFTLTPNEDYSILIEIEKSNNIDYSKDTLNLKYFNIQVRDIYGSYYDISEYISNVHFEYAMGYNIKYETGKENPFYSNKSWIVIDFHVNSNVENITPNQMEFSNFSIYINKYNEIENIKYLENNKALFNTESTGTIKHKIAFIYGGHIDIEGVCEETSGYCSGVGYEYDGELDGVTEEDRELFQEYETCELTNIPCHLRNLLTGINNIIVRLGNGIKGLFKNLISAIQRLFIPNFNNINTTFQEMKNLLITKTGFLYQSEQFFETLLNRFIGLFTNTSDTIIYIPQIQVPNFNFTIIERQEWNLTSYFRDNEILEHFYNNYKLLISGVFIFLLIEHSRRRLGTILNIGDMYENGTIREGLK